MTQPQSKQPILVSVDRNSKASGTVRVADAGLEADRAQVTKPAAAEAVNGSKAEMFAGFVFEEVGSPQPAASALQSVRRGMESEVAPKQVADTATPSGAAAPMAKLSVKPVSVPVAATPAPANSNPAPANSNPAPANSNEEKRARQDEQPKPTATETTAGVSTNTATRGDLDLRARLNQKESELLSLRSEISARDRQLLDLNNNMLEVERSRIELGEQLEQHALRLDESKIKLRALEVDKEAAAKRIEEMNAGFRRSAENWKRKNEAEFEALKSAHATELGEQAAAHATKLENLERAHAAELTRLRAATATSQQETAEKHSEAIKNMEAASNRALSNAVAAYTKKIRALRELQEKALANTITSDAAALEAALAAAASEKAGALAEAESAHRATQGELSAAQATAQFLERTQATQAERIARQDSAIAGLEDELKRATARADAAVETLANLRRAFGAGLKLLNGATDDA